MHPSLPEGPSSCEEVALKTDLNAKVNIWGAELSDYSIKFNFIKVLQTPLQTPCQS